MTDKSDVEMTKLRINYFYSDLLEINIVRKIDFDSLIKSTNTSLDFEINTLLGQIPVFKYGENQYLIGYTLNDFGLKINNKDDLNRLVRNDDHDLISIIKEDKSYYYGFKLSSSKISELITTQGFKIKKGYGRTFYAPPGHGDDVISKVVQFDNGGVLIYHERAKDVYQGKWFADWENFKFYYDNGYAG